MVVLCLFNPFSIQYIPLENIDNMSLSIQYATETDSGI